MLHWKRLSVEHEKGFIHIYAFSDAFIQICTQNLTVRMLSIGSRQKGSSQELCVVVEAQSLSFSMPVLLSPSVCLSVVSILKTAQRIRMALKTDRQKGRGEIRALQN